MISSARSSNHDLFLTGYYQNCGGLRTKLNIVKCNVTSLNYVFFVLCETWLYDGISDNELGFINYNIYRRDRGVESSNHNRGGGVLIAVHKDIPSHVIPSSSRVEHLFVAFTYKKSNFVISGAYLPPRCPVELYDLHMSFVSSLIQSSTNSHFILCGDYNLPEISWSNDNLGLIYSFSTTPRVFSVPEVFASLNFFQNNCMPNDNGSFLDLIFSESSFVRVTRALDPLVPNSHHHLALEISLPILLEEKFLDTSHHFYNFRKANYSPIRKFLSSFDWPNTFCYLDIETAVNTFYDALHFSVINFIPKSCFRASKYHPWFTSELKNLVLAKKRAHIKYKLTADPFDYRTFSLLRAKFKFLSKKCYREYVSCTEKSFVQDPSKFWKFVRHNKSNSGIPATMRFNDSAASDNSGVANLFSDYFSTVYATGNARVHDVPLPTFSDLPNNVAFSLEDISVGLSRLKNINSVGPDGLSGYFLFNLTSELTLPLWILFKRSLDERVFPSIWKLSSVTPIFKSGDKDDVKNYRPISILSHLAKLFESLVVHHIQPSVNQILVQEQHGFRPCRSVVTNLLLFTNFVSSVIEKRSQVDVIYLDFAKAFDRVNHASLLTILEASGFGEPLLSWFKSYLSDRVQFVKINNIKSNIVTIPSGVPQGGHLSPLLFALFINGISSVLKHCQFLIFADDIKIFLRINSSNDCIVLQSELDCLANWVRDLGLEFNVSKCESMSFSRVRVPINFLYSINGTPLTPVSSKTDLGIVFASNLSFQKHIMTTSCRALKTLGFLKRMASEFKLVRSLKTLYCALVRSIVEFGSIIWNPMTSLERNQNERVQRKFLNFAAFKLKIEHPPHSYATVSDQLKLCSLSDRRVLAGSSLLLNLINGSIDCPSLLELVNFKVPSRTTRISVPFAIPFHSTAYGRNNPLHRIMRNANVDPFFLTQNFF